ncbi:IclR family transcriptional regulator [Nocardia sp. A7]|uniref:IclR family transcriptional regulator n=1 Tax=Nocardia sp. A7 TaxID=2789274 RepID=UPI003979931D
MAAGPGADPGGALTTMANSTSGESVLSRVVRIFEAFDPDVPACTISELARRADLPPATTSRLVNELIEHGWLSRDAGRRISIGMRGWELITRASPVLGLRDAAMPFMQELHAVVGNPVQLAVHQDGEVLCIEQLCAPGAVRDISRFAGRLPLHASASGLVLLANSPVAVQESVLTGSSPADTVADRKRLRAVLGEIRRTGLAVCADRGRSTTSMAVPVRARSGHTVAALTVVVANRAVTRSFVPALTAAALGIAQSLGGPNPARETADRRAPAGVSAGVRGYPALTMSAGGFSA